MPSHTSEAMALELRYNKGRATYLMPIVEDLAGGSKVFWHKQFSCEGSGGS